MMQKTVRFGAALLAAGVVTSMGAAGAVDHRAQSVAVVLAPVSFVSTSAGAVAVLAGAVGKRAKRGGADEV